MKSVNTNVFIKLLLISIISSFLVINVNGQNYTEWYNNAQERIDTLRKGDFGIKIVDDNGNAYTGDVSVRLKKHEFPFGIAFDFYESSILGSTYTTEEEISASADAVVYQTERYNDYLEYNIPVESGKACKVTLKFAETYLEVADSRLFDVSIDGNLVLDDYDVFTEAGGKDIAKDTVLDIALVGDILNIESL